MLNHGQRIFLLVRRDQVIDVHLESLGLAPAVHPLRGRIPGLDATLHILQNYGVVGIVHHHRRLSEQIIGFLERFPRPLYFADIKKGDNRPLDNIFGSSAKYVQAQWFG